MRVGQLLLLLAAGALWLASRMTWVVVSSFDGLGQPETATLTGGSWSTALVPLALMLLAARAQVDGGADVAAATVGGGRRRDERRDGLSGDQPVGSSRYRGAGR